MRRRILLLWKVKIFCSSIIRNSYSSIPSHWVFNVKQKAVYFPTAGLFCFDFRANSQLKKVFNIRAINSSVTCQMGPTYLFRKTFINQSICLFLMHSHPINKRKTKTLWKSCIASCSLENYCFGRNQRHTTRAGGHCDLKNFSWEAGSAGLCELKVLPLPGRHGG